MPVLSHLHQLFNAEQCQTYIHTLRWKDRPLQCPRCQSHHIGQWGMYQYRPGCKRYWCHSCKRTFNDLTDTLLHRSQRSLAYWILATFLLCLACSSQRIAREVGLHAQTSYRWGIVNLMADTRFPGIFLDTHALKYKELLRCRKVDKRLSMVSLASQGGISWIPSSSGRAMATLCVKPSSWVSWSTLKQPAKS